MSFVQPVAGAISAWLAIWLSLPFAVQALGYVAFFFLFLSKVINIAIGGKD